MAYPLNTGKVNATKNAISLSGNGSMRDEFFIDELKRRLRKVISTSKLQQK